MKICPWCGKKLRLKHGKLFCKCGYEPVQTRRAPGKWINDNEFVFDEAVTVRDGETLEIPPPADSRQHLPHCNELESALKET